MRQWQRPGALPDACVVGRQLEAHTPLKWVYLHTPFRESCDYPWPGPASAGNCPDPLGNTRVKCLNIRLPYIATECSTSVLYVLSSACFHATARTTYPEQGWVRCLYRLSYCGWRAPTTNHSLLNANSVLFRTGGTSAASPPPTTPVTGNIHAPWSFDYPGLAGHNPPCGTSRDGMWIYARACSFLLQSLLDDARR